MSTLINNIQEFIFAGNASFQVINKITGKKFLFRVKKKDEVFFVSTKLPLFDQPGQYSEWVFFGTIFNKNRFQFSRKSSLRNDQENVVAFHSLFQNLITNQIPDSVEVHHVGKCGRCAKPLTDLDSVNTGFGSECSKKLGLVRIPAKVSNQINLPVITPKDGLRKQLADLIKTNDYVPFNSGEVIALKYECQSGGSPDAAIKYGKNNIICKFHYARPKDNKEYIVIVDFKVYGQFTLNLPQHDPVTRFAFEQFAGKIFDLFNQEKIKRKVFSYEAIFMYYLKQSNKDEMSIPTDSRKFDRWQANLSETEYQKIKDFYDDIADFVARNYQEAA